MKSAEKALAFLDEQIEERESDLLALKSARDVLARAGEAKTPAVKMLPAPGKAASEVRTRKQHQPGVMPGQPRRSQPDIVSEDSTLEPDFEMNGVDLFFTPDELKLFKALDAADDMVYVPMENLIKACGASHQSKIYALLKSVRTKLAKAHADIENKHGQGYRLIQV